ncbi:DUF885 family protein [Actinophytocola sp.]|uniref:DUF885 family protein n=1 Tax=Actinophytocola sp. TaxID=1872138 RepID=UPI003D6A3706
MDSVAGVVEHVFERYPQVGRRAGRHDLDGRLPTIEPPDLSEMDRMLTAASAGLDALPADADPELRADLGVAVQVLTDERFGIADLGRVHRGPNGWLAETDVSLYLRGNHAPFADRLAALEQHLAGIPSFLDSAAGTLGSRLPAGERISGIENARARAAGIRDLAGQLVTERPELAGGRLTGLADDASAACTRFADAVAATAPASAVFGPDRLAGYLMAAEGVDRPVDELLDETDVEVRRIVARLDELATRLGAGDRRQAYELMSEQVPDGPVVDTLERIVDRLRMFWADQDVVTISSRNGLEIRRARESASSAEVVFDIGGPLEVVPQPHILQVPEPRDTRESRVLRDYLNEPMLEMIAVHEVFPGHYLHYEATPPTASVIRRCVPWFPGATEGWAHYAEALAVERGLADGRPLVEVAALRFQLEAAARSLAFLSIHSGRWRFGDAVTTVATLCGWSAERATREVLVVVADPTGAMYTLGRLCLGRWRVLAGVGDTEADLKAFHDRLIRCGSAPLSTVWRYYLDGQCAPAPGAAS